MPQDCAKGYKDMNARARAAALSTILIIPLFLSGCGVASEHKKAIEEAVLSYSDYYIQVRDLTSQVREQSKSLDLAANVMEYDISVDIPDYVLLDSTAVPFVPSEPDLNARNASAYQQQSAYDLRQSLERYALDNEIQVFVPLTITFTVLKDEDGWSASMSSQSKLTIRKTVEGMLQSILEKNDAFMDRYHSLAVASALPAVLSDAFGSKSYAQMIHINRITQQDDGSYLASFTYPDSEYVFHALADVYISSFNQPFYGDKRLASLSANNISEVDLANAPEIGGNVTVSLSTETGLCTLLDDGGLTEQISASKSLAESVATDSVNAAWRVEALDPPKSGTIYEGKSKGNPIAFKTDINLGKYFYVRCYKISGEDLTEEGTLQLGIFINGGKSARFNLPTGNYRITCWSGENWYGVEHLFGSDGIEYEGGIVLESKSGYINNVSFSDS